MALPRRIISFESAAGATVVSFPRYDHEWERAQELRPAYAGIVGGDYAVDLLAGSPAPKQPGKEAATFTIVGADPADLDTQSDALVADLYAIGMGKLWSTGADGSRRWCWAKLDGLPSFVQVGARSRYWLSTSVTFTRNSDWFAETATTVTEPVATSPHAFTVTNNGNAPVQGVVVRFRANGTPGANMVYNPGFEISAEGTNPWSPVNGAVLARETGVTKHSGTGSLRITGDATTALQGASYVRTVSANTAYFLSAWIRLVGGEDPLTVMVEELAGGVSQGSHTQTVHWADDWQEARISFVSGAATDSVKIWVLSDGVILANIWIDDIHLGTPAGYHAPTLRNKTTGELFTVSYPAMSADDEIRVDSGPRYSCEVSTDDGLSYDAIPGALIIGEAQYNMLTLKRGANQLEYADNGTPALDVMIEFMSTWH